MGRLKSAKDLMPNKSIPKNPGIYKWWATKKVIQEIYNGITKYDDVTGNKTSAFKNMFLSELESKTIDGKTVYCFYVGKTAAKGGLNDRILKNHLLGVGRSTLRKSIEALTNPKDATDILLKCYVSWKEFDRTENNFQTSIDTAEKNEINTYLRLLNTKDFMKECKCDTQLRQEIRKNVLRARKDNTDR